MDRSLRQLGRYELRTRIAVGGMGEIFLATMRGAAGFEKRVIIKTILPHLAEEQEFVEKFLDEGRIVVQLTHGNIVPVFDMDEVHGEYYIAMEYIPGRDLRETIKRALSRGEHVPAELALHITSELCKGLGYAHGKRDEQGQSLRIVHRDVSPSNVLLSTDGEVKVIDFGIARATSRVGRTVSGRIQGKFCYMSPEQASGKPLDQRSDIFSAGVVLYEMLTGMRPFQGDSDMHSLELVRACEFDPPSALNPVLPEEIDAVVLRALARDPADRYPTAEAMQLALMHLMFEQGMVVTSGALRDYLSGLFPDGVERAELKLPGASGSAPAKKLSLDAALELELDRLSSGELGTPTGASTARTATHLSDRDAEIEALGQTVTLDSNRAASAPASATERVRVERPAGRPRTPARGNMSTPTLVEDAAPTLATPPDAADEAAEAPEQDTGATPTPAARTPLPTDPGALATPQPITGEHKALSLFDVKGFKRTMGFGVIVIPVLIAAGFMLADVFEEQRTGQVVFKTQPSGARVYLNGALLPDVRTPEPVTLAAGVSHPITLRLDGHEPIELLATGVRTRKVRVYDGGDMIFKPIAPPKPPDQTPKTRAITITLDPPDGALTADTRPVKGPPFVVELGADAINLVASHPRCDARPYTLPSSFKADTMTLALLNCQPEDTSPPDMGEPPQTHPNNTNPRPQPRRPERVKLTLKASVPDAQIAVRGGAEATGTGTLSIESFADRKLFVTATHPDHKPFKIALTDLARLKNPVTLKLAPLPAGCVQVSTALIADLTIHGKTHQVKHGSRFTLPAGDHPFTARQPALKKDMKGTATVKPGDACAVVKLFF